jgi:hypothetical protein
MAKAQFHRNQKVYVATVGTWAVIEKVTPIWAKGFDEPVRITYDVGLGREFMANELQPEENAEDAETGKGAVWRVLRARNKWQQAEDCQHHPYPGTFPVVVTDATDWGGWRVPGAEYDRDPRKIEYQARLITTAPRLLAIAQELAAMIAESPGQAPEAIERLAEQAAAIQRYLMEIPAAPVDVQPEAANSQSAAH